MNDLSAVKKKLKIVIIIMIAILLPSVVQLFARNAFANVRAVDIALLFATGLITGVLITTLKSYFKLNTDR